MVASKVLLTKGLQGVIEDPEKGHARTHVVCTLGPSSRSVEQLEKLIDAGMSVARFNFSHGDHEYHLETLKNLRTACVNKGVYVAALLDTKGPEIRTGFLENGDKIDLVEGNKVTITTDYEKKGNSTLIACSYKNLAQDVTSGQSILCADGSVVLRVESCDPENGTVECICMNNAKLGERKNMNLPGVKVKLPILTEKDVKDVVEFGVKEGVDFVAASFVTKAADVYTVRDTLANGGEAGEVWHRNNAPAVAWAITNIRLHRSVKEYAFEIDQAIKIISKIENQEGIENFDDILRASDGVMVARGDLGMEIPLEKIFLAQKVLIHKCNLAGKPVITATQMLESMCSNPRPTRAEATDVANAVLDGSDCVMLSGETAAGKFPFEAVSVMNYICKEAEQCIDYNSVFFYTVSQVGQPMSPAESLASSAVRTASKVDATCIIVLAASGDTARLISKYFPACPVVVGVVPRSRRAAIGFANQHMSASQTARQLMVHKCLKPFVLENEDPSDSTKDNAAEKCLEETMRYAKSHDIVDAGQLCVCLYNLGGGSSTVIKIVQCPTY